MERAISLIILCIFAASLAAAQSRHKKPYSESVSRYDVAVPKDDGPRSEATPNDDVVRIETDLIMIPVKVATKNGRAVPDIRREEFRVFENGEEQEIAFFNSDEAPFSVALLLDMSYSTVFKLQEIQAAAKQFISELRPNDRVMIVAFAEKFRVLCELTSERKALRYAIEATKIESGTSLYDTMADVIDRGLANASGRKAIVVLTDGVDTTSKKATFKSVIGELTESNVVVYPIRYSTYDDVQKSRRNDAQILYDDDDRPYVVETAPGRGERVEDYNVADEFMREAAERTGGAVQRVSSRTNLAQAFSRIADELRKTYSLGYYPTSNRSPGSRYYIRVRVYRPDLVVRARETYLKPALRSTN
ncbi:MAG: von Willebrand factor type A domain-containing protein [Acidobacteria bacterium OLB17]|nr:MAG: von Willebrand factor type A domain-containing protein [Acidobacteria bacterium OLB17]MCZ2389641.1 VWA domain-containing protein [Acidobacteriota bacterium]